MDDRTYILNILSKLERGGKPAIGTPYKVPENYFETFNDRFMNVVDEFQNTDGILLEQISKEPVFQVPDGYFQHFEESVTGKIITPPVGRISYFKKWYKIAAAAVIATLVALGAIKHSGTGAAPSDSVISAIAMEDVSSLELNDFTEDIPQTPGNDYNKKNIVDNNQLFTEVSSQELYNFLNERIAPGNDFF